MVTKRKRTVSKRRTPKRRMKKMDKYLIGSVLYIAAWSIAFFIAWIVLKQEPTILEGCILAPGVVEMVACAWIKRAEPKEKQPPDGSDDTHYNNYMDGGNDGSAT